MAKKDPNELSVEERLKTLYQMQAALSAIDEKRALRGELPLEVQDLEDEIEGLSTRIENIQRDIDEFQKAVTMKKGEIVEAQASVERYQKQLNEVKNNREYDTLSKEIELCNKKIKEAQNRIAEKQEELKASQEAVDERRNDLEVKKNELDEIMEETRAEEDKLKAKVKDYEAKIEPRLLASFKRIRKNARNGLGIVYVQRDACGGCFNKIPPQRQLDIKMHKKIIVCEYCGRIIDKPVAEEKKTRKRAIRKTVRKPESEDDAE